MTEVLDVVGMVALVVAGFLLALWVGFAFVGVGCLWSSYSITAKSRKPARAVQ